jgi:Glyoxalase-like domain
VFQVAIDAADPAALSEFWRQALASLGYQPAPAPPGFADWPEFLAAQGVPESEWNSAAALVDPSGQGPRLFFQRVPEPKTAKNRVHIDLGSGGGPTVPVEQQRVAVDAAVARLQQLGAAFVERAEELGVVWAVMHDPEGNEFCA